MQPVIVRSGKSLRNDIEAGPHHMIADEPASAGGTEAGPTPYDFLAAALGTCTSMTLRVVAQSLACIRSFSTVISTPSSGMLSFVATTRSVIEVQVPRAAARKSYGVGPASVPPALAGSSAIM